MILTPKQKAQDLVSKFREFADGICDETGRYSPNVEKQRAKHCALLALDEIIESNRNVIGIIVNGDYWLEVLEELEKL
jgi:hypothetical protein